MISKHMRIKMRTAKCLHVGLILAIAFVSALAHGQLLWLATWTTSPTGVPDSESFIQWNEAHTKIAWKGASIVRGTLRYWLRIPAGGEKIRLTVPNTYRQASLHIGGMTVGLAGDDLYVATGTLREVQFSGKSPSSAPAIARRRCFPLWNGGIG